MKLTVQRAIPTAEVLWPDEKDGPWLLRIEVGMVDGRPEPVSVSLKPKDESRLAPLRMSVLRTLRLSEITHRHIAEHRVALRDHIDSLTTAMTDDLDLANEVPTSMLDEWNAQHDDLAEARRRPGRPVEVTDDDYQKVADIYKEALELGDPVLSTLAKKLFISKDTAAKRIRQARKLGLLPATSRGKARAASGDLA